MKKNIFDKLSDSYDSFHFKDSEVNVGNNTLYISPKIKLVLGWSLLILCCVLAYLILGNPFAKEKGISQEEKQAILEKDVDVEDEHATIIPYEKDDDEDLNKFIEEYFAAITSCNNIKLQDMVTDSSEFSTDELLRKKADFITGYNNLTVYTKDGLDDGSYVAFVVSNLAITGVNSSPYDIVTLYIVTGAQGFKIVNGTLPEETQNYIDKVKGDKDIQKVFQSVEKENKKLTEKDKSLQDFYEIISRRNVETVSGAEGLTTESAEDGSAGEEQPSENEGEAPQTEGVGEQTPEQEVETPQEENAE